MPSFTQHHELIDSDFLRSGILENYAMGKSIVKRINSLYAKSDPVQRIAIEAEWKKYWNAKYNLRVVASMLEHGYESYCHLVPVGNKSTPAQIEANLNRLAVALRGVVDAFEAKYKEAAE